MDIKQALVGMVREPFLEQRSIPDNEWAEYAIVHETNTHTDLMVKLQDGSFRHFQISVVENFAGVNNVKWPFEQ